MNDNDVRIVRVTNISDFDFTPEMGAKFGGRPFPLRKGEDKLFPFTIGDHLATHLARQIIIKKSPIRDASQLDGRGSDRPLWDETAIDDMKKLIVAELYTEARPTVLSEADIMEARIKDLNKVDPENVTEDGSSYKDKAEVIAALEKRGISFNPRASKANLEALLAPAGNAPFDGNIDESATERE